MHLQNTINEDTDRLQQTINDDTNTLVGRLNTINDSIGGLRSSVIGETRDLRASVIGEGENIVRAIQSSSSDVLAKLNSINDSVNAVNNTVYNISNAINRISDTIVNLSKTLLRHQFNLPVAAGVTVFYTVATGNALPLSTASFVFRSDPRLVNALATYNTGYFVTSKGNNTSVRFGLAAGTTTLNHAIGPFPIRVKSTFAGQDEAIIDLLYYTAP